MKKILIVGANSAIAEAFQRRLAADGSCEFYLLGRNPERLSSLSDDLKVRGATAVTYKIHDMVDVAGIAEQVKTANDTMGGIDLALVAHGSLPDQRACEKDGELLIAEQVVNGVSTTVTMQAIANVMAVQGSGVIAVLGSVAGDRGRQSNYVYGSAKSMVESFAQGLRHRLTATDVDVLLVKPGFVDTPMTRDFDKGLLWVKPDYVAKSIIRAIHQRRSVLYVPWFWYWIMLIIRNVPEKIFHKTGL